MNTTGMPSSGGLACLGGNRAESGDKHIGLHPDQVRRKAWQQFWPTFRGPIDEVQILSVDVTKLVETAQKNRHEVAILARQQSEIGDGE